MRLCDSVRQELHALGVKVEYDEIVPFRHTKKDSDIVLKYCDDLDDWTACQPSGGRYDYRWAGETRNKILVVIVDHRLYRVFRVGEQDTVGLRGALSTDELNRSYEQREKRNRSNRKMKDEPAFRVELERVRFSKDGRRISGWEGKERCTMAKSMLSTGARSNLFWDVEIE